MRLDAVGQCTEALRIVLIQQEQRRSFLLQPAGALVVLALGYLVSLSVRE